MIGKKDTEINCISPFSQDICKNDQLVLESKMSQTFEKESFSMKNNRKIKKWYLSKKSPIRGKKGNIVGIVGVSIDITDRKNVEKALKDQKISLEKQINIKKEFIRNFSHDCRTPINSIFERIQILEYP